MTRRTPTEPTDRVAYEAALRRLTLADAALDRISVGAPDDPDPRPAIDYATAAALHDAVVALSWAIGDYAATGDHQEAARLLDIQGTIYVALTHYTDRITRRTP